MNDAISTSIVMIWKSSLVYALKIHSINKAMVQLKYNITLVCANQLRVLADQRGMALVSLHPMRNTVLVIEMGAIPPQLPII